MEDVRPYTLKLLCFTEIREPTEIIGISLYNPKSKKNRPSRERKPAGKRASRRPAVKI